MPGHRLLIIFACCLAFASAAAADAAPEVLVVNSYHQGYRWSDDIMRGIAEGLHEAGVSAKLHIEYLDSKRHPQVMQDPALPAFMHAKYDRTRFRVVITCDDNATWFVLDHRDELLPGVPQVFCGVNDLQPERLLGRHGVTGVNEYADIGETLECMLRLHPGTRRLVVVTDLTETGRGVARAVERWRGRCPGGVALDLIDRVSRDELAATIDAAGDRTLLLYTFFFQDRDGRTFDADESAALVRDHARIPVYTTWDFNQGFGMIGGKQTSGLGQGRAAAALAARILAGEAADALPVRMDSPNRWVFEHPALERFAIPRQLLPAGSLVINEPDSAYWRYRHLIWATAAVLAAMLGTIAALAWNIRGRRHAERLLRRSEESLSTTLYSIADAVVASDADGRVARMNPVAEALTGRSRDAACGRPLEACVSLVDEVTRAAIPSPMARALAGETVADAGERILLLAVDGRATPVLVSAAPIRDRFGQVSGAVVVLRDQTAARQAAQLLHDSQERLRQHEKLGAIGQLAGGVAHDFNNQLTGILGFAELLTQRCDDPGQRRAAEHIVSAALRSADLTRQLLAFARKGRVRSATVHIHATIDEVVGLLAHSVDKRIRIIQDLAAAPDTVAGDPSQLQNALLNLALNARDAMPGGGELRFATRIAEAPPAGRVMAGGRWLVIEVADTGLGMDEETRRHLFEPFFTTKSPGKGTGLGLAAVYGAVEGHGGGIAVATAVGQGTRFTIHLPLQLDAAAKVPTPVPEAATGAARILVVDDEPAVRGLMREVLAARGHQVTLCAGGEEAVQRHRDGARFDLVILDLSMPGMSGEETLAALQRIEPGVRVLLASGYSPAGAEVVKAAGACGYIGKPFRAEELAQQVVIAMGRRP